MIRRAFRSNAGQIGEGKPYNDMGMFDVAWRILAEAG